MICDIISQYAGVAESADATDSKSVGSDIVRVQVPPPAPKKAHSHLWLCAFFSTDCKDAEPLAVACDSNHLRASTEY